MHLRSAIAVSLAAIIVGTKRTPEPTIVHLRWMHRIEGMTPLQFREARHSNERITAIYDSLVATLGPGQLYVEGFASDEDVVEHQTLHKLNHRFHPAIAREVDRDMYVDGPLYQQIIEGKRVAYAAEQKETIDAYELALKERAFSELHPYYEAREDATIARIMREKPPVAYVLYGCTHDLADAVARGAHGYKLLTITTPEVERERGCDPEIFEVEQP